MPHDPALVEDTRNWFSRASRDLRAAEHGLRATPPLSWDAVFHCQQAAEKALKAFLAWHDEPFGKTHNLEELGRKVTVFDPCSSGPGRSRWQADRIYSQVSCLKHAGRRCPIENHYRNPREGRFDYGLGCMEQPGGHQAMELRLGRLAHDSKHRRSARGRQVLIAAKDGSAGFDFEGTYTRIVAQRIIEYRLGDGRDVKVEFTEGADGVLVRETFEAESQNDRELQRRGWQAILDNFARHVEAKEIAGTAGN